MSALLLVGASGLAREVLASGIDDVVGILDDDESLEGTVVGGVPVLGPSSRAAEGSHRLLVCIGSGAARRRVVASMRARGVDPERWASHVAPSARVGASSSIGAGSIVLDAAVVTADAVVGQHVVIMPQCTITHDDVVEDFATLAAGVALGGGARIGEAAYLGMRSSIRQGVRIGSGAVIGMGAVVLRDVPGGETWVGVPARRRGEGR